jgi:drug/metabolite transporter (DMT)-like permease
MTPAALAARDRLRILLAFGAIYFIWGATYIATRFAVEAIPPFVMGSSRMLLAGGLLYGFARFRGALAPTRTELLSAAASGVLMLGLGNGAVVWSVQYVPSGIVALLVACVPLWMVLADWLRPNGSRPRALVTVGVALGLIGIVVLVGPRIFVGVSEIDPVGVVVLVLGSMSWAIGSLFTRHQPKPRSALVSIALQMSAAGVTFLLGAILFGDFPRFAVERLTMKSLISWTFLVLGGSIVAYTAYVYLLGVVSPAKAATYAYVNPVIAVILGWAFAGEPLVARTVVAMAIILGSVALITVAQSVPAIRAAAPKNSMPNAQPAGLPDALP